MLLSFISELMLYIYICIVQCVLQYAMQILFETNLGGGGKCLVGCFKKKPRPRLDGLRLALAGHRHVQHAQDGVGMACHLAASSLGPDSFFHSFQPSFFSNTSRFPLGFRRSSRKIRIPGLRIKWKAPSELRACFPWLQRPLQKVCHFLGGGLVENTVMSQKVKVERSVAQQSSSLPFG